MPTHLITRRRLLQGATACVAFARTAVGPSHAQNNPGAYVCPPCGCDADGEEFVGPGRCGACGMTLQPKNPPFEPASLTPGGNLFLTAGGPGHESASIGVHTYLPESYTPSSPILLVIPGDGRNGAEYRDAWIEAADQTGVLVAALAYAEADYDFAAYQMGGVIRDLEVRNMPVGPDGETSSIIELRDEDLSFASNPRREEWLFNDFDRIFDLVATAARSGRSTYDMFGHSAGGQILHRSVLFNPLSAADRIIAANAGQYTQPDLELPLMFGMKDTGVTEASLAESFARRLTLLIGEEDNNALAGGTLLRTPQLDEFGVYRLERGRVFFTAAQQRARSMRAAFNWTLETVPNVGHDYRAMSRAAALRLYG
jgi:hypothetical protein